MKTKNSQSNKTRPAAFIAAKHEIMNALDATGIKRAQKAMDNYVYTICEKPLRKEHQLDLIYILNWRIAQLRDDGIDTPEPQNISGYEDPITTEIHARQMGSL